MTVGGWSPESREAARRAAVEAADEIRRERRDRRKRGAKRKRRRVLRDLRESEGHLVEAGRRFARAVDAGLAEYAGASGSSRAERGELEAFVLAPVHALRGAAVLVRESAEVPAELAAALDRKSFRRVARLTVLAPLRGARRR